MKNILFLASSLLALAACQSDTYYAEGVSIGQRDSDLARCNSEAHRDHPPNLITRYTPRVFHPGTQVCTAPGVCHMTAPYWTGGNPYTVDLNRQVRSSTVTGCMADRGYTLISLPSCRQGTASASTTMAPLGSDTCLIDRENGGALVVNP